jgi:exosome complex exonuclease RRP6
MATEVQNIDLVADFAAYQALVQKSVIEVTKSATFVSKQDLSFHRNANDGLSRSLDSQNAHLLRLTNKLLKAATQDLPIKTPVLQNVDSVDDNWRKIVDVVDSLLERADSALDEFSGVIKPQSPSHKDTESPKPVRANFGVQRGSAKDDIPKPQLHFERQVNNYDSTPFRPLLQTKPHAIIPLEKSIGNAQIG